jgi:hypothetical protein
MATRVTLHEGGRFATIENMQAEGFAVFFMKAVEKYPAILKDLETDVLPVMMKYQAWREENSRKCVEDESKVQPWNVPLGKGSEWTDLGHSRVSGITQAANLRDAIATWCIDCLFITTKKYYPDAAIEFNDFTEVPHLRAFEYALKHLLEWASGTCPVGLRLLIFDAAEGSPEADSLQSMTITPSTCRSARRTFNNFAPKKISAGKSASVGQCPVRTQVVVEGMGGLCYPGTDSKKPRNIEVFACKV